MELHDLHSSLNTIVTTVIRCENEIGRARGTRGIEGTPRNFWSENLTERTLERPRRRR